MPEYREACIDCGRWTKFTCPGGWLTCSECSVAREKAAGTTEADKVPDCPAHGEYLPAEDTP